MTPDALSLLGDFDVDTFLNEYWQKKPLLIRNALPDFKDPLSPEELAGLACEEEAEARLVFKEAEQWRLQSGPFQEGDFTSLPEHNWTLLVQAVDHWFPRVKALMQAVPFIPSWRVDDVMVSYAEKNAGVGPHFDYYDVFIIQGQGSRNWKIGQTCNSQSELISDSGLKILKHFEQQEQWQLNSGDVLYIPPGLAHYGVSLDSSLSYSIGFRAPSASEILISYSDEICAALNDDERFEDAKPERPNSPGEINSAVIRQIEALIQSSLKDNQALPNWFGKYMTEPKNEEAIAVPNDAMQAKDLLLAFVAGDALAKHPASRVAFIQEQDTLTLFVDGEAFSYDKASTLLLSLNKLLNLATDGAPLDLSPYFDDVETLDLLTQLYNQGSLIFIE